MAIVKVQSVTGNGATLVLNGVAAGNALFLQMSCLRVGGTSAAPATPTDSNGTFAVSSADAMVSIGSDFLGVAIWHEQNAAAGTHTVTPATGLSYNCTLTEFSGLATAGLLDQPKSAGTANFAGTSQVTGTTATTAQADELSLINLCLGALSGVANVGITDPVTNYTTLQILQNDATGLAMHHSYSILVATGTQSATENWTDTETGQSSMACIATFKGASAADIGSATYQRTRAGRGPGAGPSMRRMLPQQFPTPSQIDIVTSLPQMPQLRARGQGMGPRLRRMFPQQFPQAGIATVTAKVGPYTWAGAASSLAVLIGAHVGAWTWTGKSSPLSTEVPGKVGAYTWAGKQASLATEIRSTAGAYTWTGKAASLAASIVSRVGPYTWSGVQSAVPKQVTEAVGSYTWAGRSATFGSTVTFSSTIGTYAWSGITAPVLRFVSSTTGAYNWLGSAAVIVGGTPPAVVERLSGGWEYARRARNRLEEELRTEREQWGILPKAAQIVSAVAIRQADALDLDAEQRLEELERELELAGVRYQGQYLELLNLQRQRLIDAEIRGYFEAEEALNEENKRRLMLLLAFLS